MKGIDIAIIVMLIIIVAGTTYAYFEVKEMRGFCYSINGTPSYTGQSCNGEKIYLYEDGWDFNRPDYADFEINLSNISYP
jgi:hypothetical protein